jgi:hypothetical protein
MVEHGTAAERTAAVAAIEDALSQPGMAEGRTDRALLLLVQAELLARLGADGDEDAARRALSRFQAATAATTRGETPFSWIELRLRTAESLLLLAPKLGGDTLEKARQAAAEARQALLELDAPAFLQRSEAVLEKASPAP